MYGPDSNNFPEIMIHTVDGRNPAPVDMVVYPITDKVLYFQGGAGFLPSTVAYTVGRFTIQNTYMV